MKDRQGGAAQGRFAGIGRLALVAGKLAALLTLLATGMALLARAWWGFELFSHFPLHYLAGQCFALLVFLLHRHRGVHPAWLLLVLVAAVPNVMAVGPYLPGLFRDANAGAGRDSFTLVAANLLYTADDAGPVLDYVARRDPDLLVLSEYTPRWGRALAEALDHRYPYALVLPRQGAWGMALYSRHPLREAAVVDLDGGEAVNIRAVVELPRGALEVWGLHLASPTAPDRAALRSRQLAELARQLAVPAPAGMPRIVAGDFNTTAFSPLFRDLLRSSGLRDARRPFGLQVTWPAWPVPLWIAIDQVLAGDGVTVHRLDSGPPIGSDHFPVEVVFSLAKPGDHDP
jgi:endonuclease/exonuclease/phosphatase (EEP) superfamily protein YafD